MSEYTPSYGALNGALIERGKVISIDADSGAYTLESIDRENVTTLALPYLFGKLDKREVRVYDDDDLLSAWRCREDFTIPRVGDNVFFFMFADGSGRVICKM